MQFVKALILIVTKLNLAGHEAKWKAEDCVRMIWAIGQTYFENQHPNLLLEFEKRPLTPVGNV